jgi:hypothetical protein
LSHFRLRNCRDVERTQSDRNWLRYCGWTVCEAVKEPGFVTVAGKLTLCDCDDGPGIDAPDVVFTEPECDVIDDGLLPVLDEVLIFAECEWGRVLVGMSISTKLGVVYMTCCRAFSAPFGRST